MEGEELRFTGNWFIDAGILGFVNLMEEVYILNREQRDTLATLQALLSSQTQETILTTFYYAYIRYYMKHTIIKFRDKIQPKGRTKLAKEIARKKEEFSPIIRQCFQKVTIDQILSASREDVRKRLLRENEELRKLFVEYFERYNSEIKKNTSQNKKTPVQTVKDRLGIIIEIPFFQNLSFLNPSKNTRNNQAKVLKSFEMIIYERKIKTKGTPNVLDKTISKFMFAEEEFPNESYGKLSTLDDLKKLVSLPQIYLLSFPIPFIAINYRSYQTNVLFYTPDILVTYKVMKRLETKRAEIKNRSPNIFKITWNSILDELIENKGKFSLENLYLIEYRGLDRQSLVDVEYIGIPKLHASIILNDAIRESLNVNLPIKIKDKSKNKPRENLTLSDFEGEWVLETFLKNRSLFSLVVRHLNFYLSLGRPPYLKTSLYALAIDAKLKANDTETSVFGKSFLERPKQAVMEVNEYYEDMIKATPAIKGISESINEKNLVHPLFSAVRRHNRNAFVNILLRALLQVGNKNNASLINSYIFRRILNNDSSWEDFALALVIGLTGGGVDVGS